MLVRYCATHVRHFGYPRVLGLRWTGWTIWTAGGLCKACCEQERIRREADPRDEVLVPAPVGPGPRMLGWRIIVAFIAGAAAAVTAVLSVVPPPDHIRSGGEPRLLSSGARFAEPPPAQVEPRSDTPVLRRPDDEAPAAPGVMAPRAAHRHRRAVAAAPPAPAHPAAVAAASPATAHPTAVAAAPPAPAHRTAVAIRPGPRADLRGQPVGPDTVQAP